MSFPLDFDAVRPTDPVSVALEDLRARRGRVYASRMPRPWGLRFARSAGCVFHVLTRGAGALWIDGVPHPLRVGEMVLLPHGDAHEVGERRDGWPAVFPPQASVVRDWSGGTPDAAELVCGEVEVDESAVFPLMEALPHVLRIDADAPVHGLLALLREEAGAERAGSGALVTRLVELLLVHAVRRWAEEAAEAPAWVIGARDPVVGRVLAAVNADPRSAWSMERLARVAGASRSRLAARFSGLIGVPPMAWVHRVRLTAAARALGAGEARIAEVAARAGYASPAAFSRAFKRALGVSPRAWRQAAIGRAEAQGAR